MKRQKSVPLVLVCTALSVAGLGLVTSQASAQTAAGEVNVPGGDVNLGTVELPRRTVANGETLASGTYEIHVTAASAVPDAPGQLPVLERWAEFLQGGEVRGREVVSIVPPSEIDGVAKTAPPASGTSRVEMLKDNDYLRVWVNQNNTHYFIHLVAG